MIGWALLLVLSAGLDEDPAFLKARQHYDELEFEAAREAFQEAEPTTADDNVEIFLWLGLCAAETLDFELARENFLLALALDSDAQLPVRVSPKITDAFSAAQAEAAAIAARANGDRGTADAATDAPDDGFQDNESRDTDTTDSGRLSTDADADPLTYTPETAAGDGSSMWIYAGAGVWAAAAVAVVGTIGLLATSGVFFFRANDASVSQPDAQTYGYVANGALWGGGVLGAIALGALATGGALLTWGLAE